jgi:hypothetical protein
MSQRIAYGCRAAPPLLLCVPRPLPLKGDVTLTEVICFAIYGTPLTVDDLKSELDDALSALEDDAGNGWGTKEMEPLIARVYEALAESVDAGEVRLLGICVDHTTGAERPRTSAAAQRVEIPFPACGDLIHDLCGNALLQRSAIDNPDIEDARTWQNVVMSARDAQAVLERISAFAEQDGARFAESRCRLWLAQQMRKSPQRPPMPKQNFKTDCLKRFPRLTGRRFDTAWKMALVDSESKWDAAGRPRKAAR